MDILVKHLQESDKESLVVLLSEQFQIYNSNEREEQKKRVKFCYQAMKIDNTLTVLVAMDHETICGYITIQWLKELWTNFPEAFISNFYVGSIWRNKGIGNSLLEAAVFEAKKRKAARIFLENNRKNPIYQNQFYSKKGWVERSDIAIFEFPLSF